VIIENAIKPNETISAALHPKNSELGQRQVPIGQRLLIDQQDAQLFQPNTTVTFIQWGNLRITAVERSSDGLVTAIKAKLDLDNKDFKKTLKVTWLEETTKIPALLVYYDNIIKKPVLGKDDDFKEFLNRDSKMAIEAFVDGDLRTLPNGRIIQIQRKGFFICDRSYDMSAVNFSGKPGPIYLISIPDGSTDLNIFPKRVQDWKKKNVWVEPPPPSSVQTSKNNNNDLSLTNLDCLIRKQGDIVRQLKSAKATKEQIKIEVDKLLSLKSQFKQQSGNDWNPNATVISPPTNSGGDSSNATDLDEKIRQQGDKIRKMKAEKAEKQQLEKEVQILLKLKNDFKQQTGQDWKPSNSTSSANHQPPKSSNNKNNKTKSEKSSNNKENKNTQQQQCPDSKSKTVKKQTRLGIETKKSENYSEWYTEVITKAEMIEYYDVSGCYILRPWSYSIWESIQQYFDQRIKRLGVQNCYFPMFISKNALETEKTHIADFAPEVAWVTKSGSSDLAEPIAIRPTSETVMYPSYAKWIQSYRDLPIRLNQWCNVVRWEFKQPTPFLRTREFLWQEGHSAFATEQQALEEVYAILDFYADIYQKLLAIPVVKGRKTEKEKFAGGQMTTTCEAYVHVNGRGIQGATSHYLGQNFSKMFDIQFEDPEKPGEKCYAHQNSWGISTRTIGALIMIHGDDKGLVLPPRVACKQVVIVPCGITASTTMEEKEKLLNTCRTLGDRLIGNDIRVELDDKEHHSPGWKFNHWELKGVPIRIELGPKDLQQEKFVAVRRDSGEKYTYNLSEANVVIAELLERIQNDMFERAQQLLLNNMCITESWSTFLQRLDCKSIILSPFCGQSPCEDQIKKDSAKEDLTEQSDGPLMGAKSLCIPLDQPRTLAPNQLCIHPQCKQLAKFYTLFGRSY
ncbi:bifunctional glutamate/proline-tRNA ligase-like protein, partial [Euroglyphus maynei]